MNPAGAQRQIRQWRRGRATLSTMELLGEIYIVVFAVVMVSAMSISVILGVGRDVASAPCTAECDQARAVLPAAAVLLVLVMVLALARLFGPVNVSPATASWLLPTALDRARLLQPRLSVALLIAAAVCGLSAGAIVAMAGHGRLLIGTIATTATGIGLALAALAALDQSKDRDLGRWLQWAGLGAGAAALLLLATGRADAVLDAARSPDPTGPLTGATAGAGLGVVCLAAAGLLTVAAVRRLGDLTLRKLSSGAALTPGISGALAALDLGLAYDVLLAHRWASHPPVRSRRIARGGPWVIVASDVVRLRRSWSRVLLLAGATLIPWAVAVTDPGRFLFLLSTLVGFLALLPNLVGVRVFSRTPALARTLPFGTFTTRAFSMVIPGLLAFGFALVCAPALARTMQLGTAEMLGIAVALGLAVAAASLRWVSGRPPDYTAPLVSTPAGAMPANLYGSAWRGFDIALLVSLPVLIGVWPAVLSSALSVLVILVLVSPSPTRR